MDDHSNQATCNAKAFYVHFYSNKDCEGKEDWNVDYIFDECMSDSKVSYKLTNDNWCIQFDLKKVIKSIN